MAYITLDVDLDEFDNDDIIYEIENRLQRKTIKQGELEELRRILSTSGVIVVDTLNDQMKLDHITNVFSKYSLEDFERLIPQ